MVRGKQREHQRVILPGGLWVNLYADGSVKLGAYDHRLVVTELTTRGASATGSGGTSIHLRIEPTAEQPRQTAERADDLVTIRRSTRDALRRMIPDSDS